MPSTCPPDQALQPGDTVRFVNDHDPLPLLDQWRARYGARISIDYQRRDPGVIESHH